MKLGGLNVRKRWSVLAICFGLATALVGSRRGLAPRIFVLTVKMV